ncbi:MAG: TfoX/Sxy family protein [Ruminococcus sp.]|nr:TfoX/Sxy family protein [Ruminococcus sp.]
MATNKEYIEYVSEILKDIGDITYKKMFGEYMIYINSKPLITVCNNTCFIKQKDEIKDLMQNAPLGFPYNGAKEHYILDIDNYELSKKVLIKLESITPLPKKKIKK